MISRLVSLVKGNPNAVVSAVGTGVAELVLYLLGRYAGIHLGAKAELGIGGAVSGALLFVGRNGLDGVLRLILHGRGSAAPPPPPPPPPAK